MHYQIPLNLLLFLGSLLVGNQLAAWAQMPVSNTHPRLFLDSATKTALMAKKTANDDDWLALKAEADNYATRPVLAWTPANAGIWDNTYIFYSYCGSSWDDAAFALGMAHQLTKGNNTGAYPTLYSDKLLELADAMITAYTTYPPCSGCPNMLQWNSSYATRHVGNVLGIIYDWCYDELDATRKTALLNLMNNWFAYMRVPYNVYQNDVSATGNYFFGHVLCSAYMGYATMYDSPNAQAMIDYARQRVLGTQSGSLLPSDLANNYLKQSFVGGIPSSASSSYLGPSSYTAAPQKDGIPLQGWAYGSGTMDRLIDYCFIVKSATGEQISDSLYIYFSKTSEAFVHALTPNRFQVDNSNDWGSFLGNILGYSMPLRLSAVLENTPQGPIAQYFYQNWIQPVTLANTWNHGYPELNWERLLYRNPNRPASVFNYPPFYPTPTDNVITSVPIDKGLPKYYMRHDWGTRSVWSVLNMSCAFYDDHDHHNAGHFQILRGDPQDGDDLLLVGANEIGAINSYGQNGIEGGTCYHFTSSLSNTLFFDDFQDYTQNNTNGYTVGGQSFYGYDEPTHAEQNNEFSYVRADLTSAYHRNGQLADTVNTTLKFFCRSFLYLRSSDIFLTYDKIRARNSTNPLGQYRKHLRWHFLEQPTLNGNQITALKGSSKLQVHTALPTNASTNLVSELSNPDNTFGTSLNYAFNTPTWRAEVSQSGNPLSQTFLTVFKAGADIDAPISTAALYTNENNMDGCTITSNAILTDIVLFNNNSAKYPTPINSCNYTFLGGCETLHTLCGLSPNATYQVDYNNQTVSVNQQAGGSLMASPSGILQFRVFIPTIDGSNDACQGGIQTYSVPLEASSTYVWSVTGGTILNGQGTNTVTIQWDTNTSSGSINIVEIK